MTLEDAIQDVLNRSELPLKAAAVAKLAKPMIGRTATPKAVAAALELMSAAGRLNRIVAGAVPPFFTTHGLEAVTVAWLKQCIQASKKEQPAAKLKSKLPAALQTHFETALGQLVGEGDAFVLPGAHQLVCARRPKPSELLSAVQRRALQKILDVANAARAGPY